MLVQTTNLEGETIQEIQKSSLKSNLVTNSQSAYTTLNLEVSYAKMANQTNKKIP